MKILGRGTVSIFLLAFSTLLLCTRTDTVNMPYVAVVIGDAKLIRSAQTSPLISRQILKSNDTITVSDNSKVKILFLNGEALYINKNTKASFGLITRNEQAETHVPVQLHQGEMLFACEDTGKSPDYLLLTTPLGELFASDADISVTCDSVSGELTVLQLSGFSKIKIGAEKTIHIPACSSFVMKKTNSGHIMRSSENEIDKLKEWAGKTIIEKLMGSSGCFAQAKDTLSVENQPPVWKSTPVEVCMAGELFVDTVKASDPEGSDVFYSLIDGPTDMLLDGVSGIIRFRPTLTGKTGVKIRATDIDSQMSEMEYSLTVVSELVAVLNFPAKVKPDEQFLIKVSSRGAGIKDLSCRIDLDGDGKYDFPESGKFGPHLSKKHFFKKEGEYKIRVEIKDKDGKQASVSRLITVNQPPRAAIRVTPSLGTINTQFEVDASECFDSQDSTELKVRFDINGDGSWDLPVDGKFSKEKKVTYSWKEPGVYRVIVQAVDSHDERDTVSAEVTVSRRFSIDSITSPDSANVGDSIVFECKIADPEFEIAKYVWSMDNDTKFEKQSLENRFQHAFSKAGKFFVRCQVTDKKGQVSEQQKTITIVNSSCDVDAGGPYKASVGAPVTLEGKAQDPDSRITVYYWDYDGNGTPDWSSKSSSRTTNKFTRSGKYTATLTVETDDGVKAVDSAFVEITNKPPTAVAGEDIIARANRKTRLNGNGEDPEGNIVLYEWDFDGDGVFDWSSPDTAMVEHVFKKYAIAVLRVMDSDSATALDSVKVVICPEDMQLINGGRFCIDQYEWPNKKNEMPQLDISYEQAVEKCRQVGKKLCTPEQWEAACNKEQQKNDYPYGRKFEIERCNTIGNPFVKNKPAASGAFAECAGSDKVFDMSGNAAEWTLSSNGSPSAYGGSWQSGEKNSRCDSRVQLEKNRNYFYVGFRCCK